MSIQIHIDAANGDELNAALQALSGLLTPPLGGTVAMPVVETSAPAPAKQKRNRRTKAEIEAAKAAETTGPTLVHSDTDTADATPDEPSYTISDIRSKMAEIIATHGDDGPQVAMDILTSFDAEKVSMLDEKHYAAYIAAADAALTEKQSA